MANNNQRVQNPWSAQKALWSLKYEVFDRRDESEPVLLRLLRSHHIMSWGAARSYTHTSSFQVGLTFQFYLGSVQGHEYVE